MDSRTSCAGPGPEGGPRLFLKSLKLHKYFCAPGEVAGGDGWVILVRGGNFSKERTGSAFTGETWLREWAPPGGPGYPATPD